MNGINLEEELLKVKELQVKTNLLKKSKFYYNTNNELREHIATYKEYAILLKQEEPIDNKESKTTEIHPSIIKISELKQYKKVNGNIVRKMNPSTLDKFTKIMMIQEVIKKIDTNTLD